jgi:hypothetical protein
VEPFRLIFEKQTGEVTNIEVRSLAGLRTVAERLESGEIQEMNRFSSLEMQLWGLLAERVGFLRRGPPQAGLAAGIMPLGEQATAFAEDMAPLFGDEVSALNALAEMREKAQKAGELVNPKLRPKPVPSEHKFVQADGVNLTTEGEKLLAKIVGANEIDMQSDNAAQLMRKSEAGLSSEELDEIEEANKVDEAIHGEPKPQTGPVAAAIGMAVEAIRPVESDGLREIYRREGDSWVKIAFPALRSSDHFVMIDDANTNPANAKVWRAVGWPAKNDDGVWAIQAEPVESDVDDGSSENQEDQPGSDA